MKPTRTGNASLSIITSKLRSRARQAHEDFRAIVASIRKTTTLLQPRFIVEVALFGGRTVLLEPNGLDDKFKEYLERAQQRLLERMRRQGIGHPDYASLLGSLSTVQRLDTENEITVKAWNVAKGPFLEALCLLADVATRKSTKASVRLCLFKPVGPIQVFEDGEELFIWSQPKMVGTKSAMNACPDIVITTAPSVSAATVRAVRECKCHRRLASDEIRKECGKAADLVPPSYVIVSYHKVTKKNRRGAEGLGLKIEEIGLDTAHREAYVTGERNIALDLGDKLVQDDKDAPFRKLLESGGVLAKAKEEYR